MGPEGGVLSSMTVPQVQASFPEGALTKKIRVGLQVYKHLNVLSEFIELYFEHTQYFCLNIFNYFTVAKNVSKCVQVTVRRMNSKITTKERHK